MRSKSRERLGKLVREIWVEWAKEQPNPKPSWLVPWEELSEPDKEVDRRIGEKLFGFGVVHGHLSADHLVVNAYVAGGNNETIIASHEVTLDKPDAIVSETWTGEGVDKNYSVKLPFAQLVHLALNTTSKERAEIDARADWRGCDETTMCDPYTTKQPTTVPPPPRPQT